MEVTVKEGHTLDDYMVTFGYTEGELRMANPGIKDNVIAGQRIELPTPESLNEMYAAQEEGIRIRPERSIREDMSYDRPPTVVPVSIESNTTGESTTVPLIVEEAPLLGKPISTTQGSWPQVGTNVWSEGAVGMDDQEKYLQGIMKIETGGLSDPFIRTNVKPREGEQGSSAYGPYQITSEHLEGALNNKDIPLTPEERTALEKVLARQHDSLIVGGRDAKIYGPGGPKELEGKALAQKWGYQDLSKFIKDFDYGGSLGYDGDKLVLTQAQKKIALQNYKEAGNDPVKAAGQWHGGKNWKGGIYEGRTLEYMEKFKRVIDSGLK